MKVWVLEWYCGDVDGYQLEALFLNFDSIADYLALKHPKDVFISEQDDEQVKFWKPDYYVAPQLRTHYSMERSDYVAFEQEVL